MDNCDLSYRASDAIKRAVLEHLHNSGMLKHQHKHEQLCMTEDGFNSLLFPQSLENKVALIVANAMVDSLP